MSRLDDLIAQYCPDGVEYKRLADIATITRGGNFQKKDFTEDGIPCIHYGQIYTSYSLFPEKTISFISSDIAARQKFAEPNDIIMAVTSENIEDVCKCVTWMGKEKVAVSGHTAIIHHSIDSKFLNYYFHSEHFFRQKVKLAHGTKVIEVTPDKLSDISVPVPPLPVQQEIVRILDSFTETLSSLQKILEHRLSNESKVYEYYRNKLLNQPANLVSLKDIIKKSTSGATPTKGKSEYYVNGDIPWIRSQDVCFNEIHEVHSFITEKAVNETSAKWIPENCVIVAISGASAGRCAVNKIKATTNQHCLNMVIDPEKADYKYVFYCVQNSYDELLSKKQGARGDLNSTLILSTKIPLPPLDDQIKIRNSIEEYFSIHQRYSSVLRAEIEARQKQYEYYRDKLLSFKEKKTLTV